MAKDGAPADTGAARRDAAFEDASPSDATEQDAEVVDAAEDAGSTDAWVPVFVAQGHVGRTAISCDDGMSWIHDTNDDDTIVCYDPDECDHAPHSAAGITYNDGWFFASFGHGSPSGTLRRSPDGIHWQVMGTGDSGGGINFFDGVLLWMNGQFGISTDLGVTVEPNTSHVPGGYFLSRTISSAENIIVASGDDPGGLVSQDSGRTWQTVSLTGAAWGRNVLIARGNNGLLVAVSAVHGATTTAYAATSSDDGLTWSGTVLYDGPDYAGWPALFFDGANFVGWFDNQMWKSADGVSWTSTPIVTRPAAGVMTDGPIARGPSGTFVSITNVWDNYYDRQRAYRSNDGINWTMLDAASFTGGHPISRIVSGYVEASACR